MSGTDDTDKDDIVWKALADRTRREILDLLSRKPRTTGELCLCFEQLCRTAVMKHLGILEEANLVLVRREGKFRWNFMNPVPIREICERWIDRHTEVRASALIRLKKQSERQHKTKKTRRKKK